MIDKETTGKVLKKIRKQTSLTQMQLAEKIGATQANISQWENGGCYPRDDVREMLGKILNYDINAIIYFGMMVRNKNSEATTQSVESFLAESHTSVPKGSCNNKSQDSDSSSAPVREEEERTKEEHPRTFTSMPPGIVEEHDIGEMEGKTHFSFPDKKEFEYLYGLKIYGDASAAKTWPGATFSDLIGYRARAEYHINNGKKYGHGKDFWENTALYMENQTDFPETAYDLKESFFMLYIDAYMRAMAQEYEGQVPYTLKTVLEVLEKIKRDCSKSKDGWTYLGRHIYKKCFKEGYVQNRLPGEYEGSDTDEEYRLSNYGSLHGTFNPEADGYNCWMILRLLDLKEVCMEADVPDSTNRKSRGILSFMRGKVSRYSEKNETVTYRMYIKPSETGKALLKWYDERGGKVAKHE